MRGESVCERGVERRRMRGESVCESFIQKHPELLKRCGQHLSQGEGDVKP